jgi:type I restriction enzyme S subunit
MEMMRGYKRTDVGLIPADWDAGGLGRFWSVTDCKHVTAAFVPDGFPVASIREVQSRFVDLRNAKQTTAHFYELLTEGGRKPRPGDLILSRNATVGEVAQVTASHPPFAMGQDVCLLRKKAGDCSTEFLQALFESPVILNQLANLMVGSTFKRANIEQIRNFSVPMPPPLEQRAIAAALSDVDALLAVQDRIITKKRDLKRAAMQQLLTGQTRLPGFRGAWEMRRLGDVATFHKGRGLPKSSLTPFGAEPCIHYGELFIRYPETIETICSRTDDGAGAFRSVANDVLMPTSDVTPRGLAKASSVQIDGVILGGDILVIRCNSKLVFGSFLSYTIRHHEEQILQLVTGTTVFHLYGRDMAKLTFSLPSVEEQIAIVTALTDMAAELTALEARRDKTCALKKGMMQELLTGRIRLV